MFWVSVGGERETRRQADKKSKQKGGFFHFLRGSRREVAGESGKGVEWSLLFFSDIKV